MFCGARVRGLSLFCGYLVFCGFLLFSFYLGVFVCILSVYLGAPYAFYKTFPLINKKYKA